MDAGTEGRLKVGEGQGNVSVSRKARRPGLGSPVSNVFMTDGRSLAGNLPEVLCPLDRLGGSRPLPATDCFMMNAQPVPAPCPKFPGQNFCT